MKHQIKLLFVILICAAPLFYLAAIWKDLPAIVPTHFSMSGEANDFSSRRVLWGIIGGLSLITIGSHLLLNNLHRVDPKRFGLEPSKSFAKLADGLVLFLTAINFIALLACSGHQESTARMLPVFAGLLLAFIGNVMYSLKPNYFAGIRVPWTLADDANWRATHRLAGILWFGGGIALAAFALLAGSRYLAVLIPAVVIIITVIPIAYSFWYFKQTARSGGVN